MMSTPASTCCRTISATARCTRASKAGGSGVVPASSASNVADRSGGRQAVWVVRIRSVLRFMMACSSVSQHIGLCTRMMGPLRVTAALHWADSGGIIRDRCAPHAQMTRSLCMLRCGRGTVAARRRQEKPQVWIYRQVYPLAFREPWKSPSVRSLWGSRRDSRAGCRRTIWSLCEPHSGRPWR